MKFQKITDSILAIGVHDKTIDLFESQYKVPDGVTYNSYLILDDKVAVMDTVDARASEEWFANLEQALNGRTPDYLVVSHMEPDHAANIGRAAEKYPEMKIVGNIKTFALISQFFGINFCGRSVVVKEGDLLNLGTHTLRFLMAPMVHWPEVMVSYESSEKLLFSADAFGRFGAPVEEEPWLEEGRRYYINIVGKYGVQVQSLLKKASSLDISAICPLHGPVLRKNLKEYLEKYCIWSSYTPEESGVLIACASIHGNTMKASVRLAELLKKRGLKVRLADLAREDMSGIIADAYRYSTLIVACATYNMELFPSMAEFLSCLKGKNFQKRTAGIIENGSWAPAAGKLMKAEFEGMKDITLLEPVVTIKSAMNAQSAAALEQLADAVTA